MIDLLTETRSIIRRRHNHRQVRMILLVIYTLTVLASISILWTEGG